MDKGAGTRILRLFQQVYHFRITFFIFWSDGSFCIGQIKRCTIHTMPLLPLNKIRTITPVFVPNFAFEPCSLHACGNFRCRQRPFSLFCICSLGGFLTVATAPGVFGAKNDAAVVQLLLLLLLLLPTRPAGYSSTSKLLL